MRDRQGTSASDVPSLDFDDVIHLGIYIQDNNTLSGNSQDDGLVTRTHLVKLQQDYDTLSPAHESAVLKADADNLTQCFYLEGDVDA